jgi:hypothetical protein
LDFTQSEYRDHRPRYAKRFTNTGLGVTGDTSMQFGTIWKTVTLGPRLAKK